MKGGQRLLGHVEDVLRVAPVTAAKVCRLWLEKIPWEFAPGKPFPWRRDAGQLALHIAREIHGQVEEGAFFSEDEDRIAYEAALFAAPEFTEEVSQLALELAKRRKLRADIQERADRAQLEVEKAARRRAEDPQRERAIRLSSQVFMQGPLREPWPDGPSSRVEGSFRDACLSGQAILPLVIMRPNVALEVLLAVCIEEPRHEDPFDSMVLDDFGIASWHESYPPMYFRGPFLQLLRQAPQQGLEFVLRLVNFATERWAQRESTYAPRLTGRECSEQDLSVIVQLPQGDRKWLGDVRVYRWYLDWPLQSKIITCALMALEKWLYEQLEEEKQLSPWITRILNRSESVAFAGLLCDVGKKVSELFRSELRPLLGSWEFYHWDVSIIFERTSTTVGLSHPACGRNLAVRRCRAWGIMPTQSVRSKPDERGATG